MTKTWIAQHNGHTIQIENNWRGERLTINGIVQDEHHGMATRSTLWGEIKTDDGIGEEVKANLGAIFTVQCRLFVGNQAVELTRQ